MRKLNCGPIAVLIDDQAEAVTFAVKRYGPKRDQLGAANLANVASWALSVANETGYTVDTTPIQKFFDFDNCDSSE